MRRQFLYFLLAACLLTPQAAFAGQTAAAKPQKAPNSPASQTAPVASQAEFLQAADQVLAQTSKMLDLPILHPLKKTIRTKAQIRDYLVQQEEQDKHPAKRYADKMALEAFGLIPRGFHLQHFLLDLLTQQIAGYYDPQAREFYIASWIPLSQQRMVMAHELTHALMDQHFHIETWEKAARPNDDAEAARQAVLEGSATVAMLDYEMRDFGRTVRDMPDIAPLIQMVAGESADSPGMEGAPPYLRDSLLFPYLQGAVFTQRLLKAGDGWPNFYKVFPDPPVSTQQILHPSFYLAGKAPPPVSLPNLRHLLGKDWKLLDENIVGEFGLQEVLKQYLDQGVAVPLSADWWGDRYAILQNKKTNSSLLVFRLRLDSPDHATQFFSTYGTLLRKKHPSASHAFTAPEFLQFDTASNGGVYFECRADQCLSMEGADRKDFDKVTHAMHWPRAPQPSALN